MTPVLYAHHELRGMHVLPRRPVLTIPTFGPFVSGVPGRPAPSGPTDRGRAERSAVGGWMLRIRRGRLRPTCVACVHARVHTALCV